MGDYVLLALIAKMRTLFTQQLPQLAGILPPGHSLCGRFAAAAERDQDRENVNRRIGHRRLYACGDMRKLVRIGETKFCREHWESHENRS